jgi:uncharacterized phage-like protein YoqJ
MVAGMAIDFNALRGASQRAAPTIPPCILVVAGHRPHKLGSRRVVEGVPLLDDGYEWGNPLRERARARLRAETLRLQLRAEFSRAVAAEARELDAMSGVSVDALRAAVAGAEPGSMAWDALARYEAEAARGDLGAEAERLRALPYVDGGRWRALHVDAALKETEWRQEWREPVRVGRHTVERWRAAPLLGASGVAQGFDQDACGVWARLDVPYVAVVPFPGHESCWPAPAQRTYQNVLRHAAGVLYVTPSGRNLSDEEAKAALFARNDRLIAIGDEMVSLWDGTRDGGTAHATMRFQRSGHRVIRIHPDELREEIARGDSLP